MLVTTPVEKVHMRSPRHKHSLSRMCEWLRKQSRLEEDAGKNTVIPAERKVGHIDQVLQREKSDPGSSDVVRETGSREDTNEVLEEKKQKRWMNEWSQKEREEKDEERRGRLTRPLRRGGISDWVNKADYPPAVSS
ncbi:hypothetical protein SRHO_G00128710 [Serrasalmus rhombeus]